MCNPSSDLNAKRAFRNPSLRLTLIVGAMIAVYACDDATSPASTRGKFREDGAAAVAVTAAQQPAIPPNVAAAKLDDAVPVDPQITVGTLPNGLRYYIRLNRQPQGRAELRLAVNAGSVLIRRLSSMPSMPGIFQSVSTIW